MSKKHPLDDWAWKKPLPRNEVMLLTQEEMVRRIEAARAEDASGNRRGGTWQTFSPRIKRSTAGRALPIGRVAARPGEPGNGPSWTLWHRRSA